MWDLGKFKVAKLFIICSKFASLKRGMKPADQTAPLGEALFLIQVIYYKLTWGRTDKMEYIKKGTRPVVLCTQSTTSKSREAPERARCHVMLTWTEQVTDKTVQK